MKYTMVIPSYWTRESKFSWQEGDAIYDHPTPLDNEGTLLRALHSTKILKEADFRLVIIAIATSEDINTQVEEKVANIIKSASKTVGVELLLFGPSHLKQIHRLLTCQISKEQGELLKLRGYSSIRNLCLFIPHIFGSEAAVLIDDDEVFEDPEFMTKAREFIGRNVDGRTINAVAGYYLQPNGDYRLEKALSPWIKNWGQYDSMNEAFDRIIGTEPRLKETPFAFGGNMIIHKNLFSVVPFDPNVPRGEDIDFLINARMFGFTFFLDNQLSIRHLPPPKMYSSCLQLRQDIFRFLYEKAKIENQKEVKGMTMVYPEDFDPYPGYFLRGNLTDKIETSCQLLSQEYLTQNDGRNSEEALNNIERAKTYVTQEFDPFQNLCELQKNWQTLIDYTSQREVQLKIMEIIQRGGG